MNKVFFFTSLYPKEQLKYIKENSIGAIGNANDSFQWSLVKGFEENDYQVELINIPNVGAYPLKFKKAKTNTFTFNSGKNVIGINLGFLNLNVIKHFSIYLSLYKYIKKIPKNSIKTLVIYDLYPPFLKVLKVLKKHQKNLKVIVVVPDVFGFTRDNTNCLHKLSDFLNEKSLYKNLKYVDGFVYLTESMLDKMPDFATQKKYTIVEGILNPDNLISDIRNETKKYILYTGSLDVRHGILNLVDAFLEANIVDMRLIICGDGSGKDLMLDKIKTHTTIEYLGQLDRKEAIKLQSEATLLINPRTSEGAFTKYSFPSKIIEYFLSGTPTFMYKLGGIPDEYYSYCFSTDDESISTLAKNLDEICKIDTEQLEKIGIDARKFVMENKNCKKQVSKIINLIKEL